jgi:nucleosome binding factor SPN SPT16 subunit
VDSLLVGVGVDEDTVYSRSTSMQTWLLGYELTDTLMLFTPSAVHFLASKKKVDFLKPLEAATKDLGENADLPGVTLHVRDKVSW